MAVSQASQDFSLARGRGGKTEWPIIETELPKAESGVGFLGRGSKPLATS